MLRQKRLPAIALPVHNTQKMHSRTYFTRHSRIVAESPVENGRNSREETCIHNRPCPPCFIHSQSPSAKHYAMCSSRHRDYYYYFIFFVVVLFGFDIKISAMRWTHVFLHESEQIKNLIVFVCNMIARQPADNARKVTTRTTNNREITNNNNKKIQYNKQILALHRSHRKKSERKNRNTVRINAALKKRLGIVFANTMAFMIAAAPQKSQPFVDSIKIK